MPGLKSSVFVKNDDVFASFATPPKQSAPIVDLLGNWGGREANSESSSRNGPVHTESANLPAESHGDGTGCDLGDASSEDNGGCGIGAGQVSDEGEWNGESVRYADDDIADDLADYEVLLLVLVEQALLLRLYASLFSGGH
ncbi:hypothetical protein CJ030_MR6G005972 [Morella rubra]|uniref:Uncharacterized protein n=1 Tax=Morella rubra TaxID=262757 RepID=A0A6A1VEU1_9ROSI|nr:hypothetical protein CJ030_MR6G005972 [Morella rubra]